MKVKKKSNLIKGEMDVMFYIYIAALSWSISQIVKAIIEKSQRKKISIKRIIGGNGGMPSSHSATVSSVVVLIGWYEGINSASFAVITITALIVIADALGVRREVQEHSKKINDVFEKKMDCSSNLNENIGHTLGQVITGIVIGIVISVTAIILRL
ncbi:MAG: divergent PAP2 family protein [Clostridia bacterium]|nr:divergent PAP2 family protein [Clostridia bacterium]MDD4375589.1 divergent PAP2 family protein [Clostridia bacterium]